MVVPFQGRDAAGNPTPAEVIALWRDNVFVPWTQEPFDRAAHRERAILCDASLNAVSFWPAYESRREARQEPLAIGVKGNGPTKRYAALYVPEGQEPLPRRFFTNGIGNGSNARTAPAQVPPAPASVSPASEASWVDDLSPEARQQRLREPMAKAHATALAWLHAGEERPAIEREAAQKAILQVRPADIAGGAPLGRLPAGLGRLPDVAGAVPRDLQAGGDLPGQQPGYEGVASHPVDVAMRGLMEECGARVAQVAVVIRGKGAYLRAYTLAEEGYPIAKTTDRIRWGSCSKALTGSVLVPYYMRIDPSDPWVGLRKTFAGELEISHDDPNFMNAVKMHQAFQHKTGINQNEFPGDQIYAARHDLKPEDALPAFAGALLEAGDMRLAFQNWPRSIVTQYQQYDYNNLVYVALCELLGKLGAGDFAQYVNGARAWLLPASFAEHPLYTGRSYAACRANGEVTYHSVRPWAVPTLWDGVDLILADYFGGSPDFGAGSGWWAITAREMGQVMRQLTVPGPRWPTHLEKFFMRRHKLGWGILERGPFTFANDPPPEPDDPVTQAMWHNGGSGSTGAVVAHVMKGPPRTVDVVASFNTGGITDLGEEFPNILLDAVQEAETQHLWAPVDLLEDLEFSL